MDCLGDRNVFMRLARKRAEALLGLWQAGHLTVGIRGGKTHIERFNDHWEI